jgi:hypothetical protein
MNLEKLQSLLKTPEILVFEFSAHSKASELYVKTSFLDAESNFVWEGLIPYHYRRTGLLIDSEEELALYLSKIKPYFSKSAIEDWAQDEKKYWQNELSGREVTKPFFEELAKMQWTSSFPINANPQRRLQDIKEMGYTVASRPTGKGVQREFLLVPIPKGLATGYETFTPIFRKKAIAVLDYLNVFELSSANLAGLLPDHKFPEIRWDSETKVENPDTMSESEIKDKFQLLDNQRNQQKREICRSCFQSNRRGIIFGIDYFYEGDQNWETNFIKNDMPVTKIGKTAEMGCIGCPWYDIQKWREKLNELLTNSSTKI